jgi:hypothetical protein
VKGPPIGSSVEPVQATFTVEVTSFEAGKTLQQQAEEFLKEFTVVDLTSIPQTQIIVGGETGIRYDPVPVMLSWNIVFVQHGDNLYQLMYWPVDVSEANADMDELYQTTINSFAFTD